MSNGLRIGEAPMKCSLLVVLLVYAVSLQAQVVRGRVTERTTGAPINGVLVTLVDSAQRTSGAALTNENGVFAIRAPQAGTFRVDAKRIGVRRALSEWVRVASGETRTVDLQLDALLYTLPEVVVVAIPLCARASQESDARQVAALWDEARTALTAAQISLRDRLFNARMVRYVRELDPRSLRILSETRAAAEGVVDRPFFALPATELAAKGYWRPVDEAELTIDYHAPDAEVLLSDQFLRDHCFRAVSGGRDRQNLVGLGFEPSEERARDVRGTLWLDAKTFELRYVEFRYTGMTQAGADSLRIGGEVHFARLAHGAWIVRRWFIRMPQFGRMTTPPVGVEGRAPSVLVRPVVFRLREEGGDVTAEGMRLFEKPATLVGTVHDSTQRGLPGATVRISGTPYRGVTGPDGAFRIDSLPAGAFDVLVEHPDYDALGLSAATGDAVLAEGETKRINLRAHHTRGVVERLCEGRRPVHLRGTVRVAVKDSVAGTPLAFVPLALSWSDVSGSGNTVTQRTRELQGTSDSKGSVVFCEVPSEKALTLSVVFPNTPPRVLFQLQLADREVAAREVRVRR